MYTTVAGTAVAPCLRVKVATLTPNTSSENDAVTVVATLTPVALFAGVLPTTVGATLPSVGTSGGASGESIGPASWVEQVCGLEPSRWHRLSAVWQV